jgi:hypothetical protein
MASLGLNPVMNIIALPFALVVSVIAATTVFRNVFVAYDSFGHDSSSGARSASTFRNGGGVLRFFGSPWSTTPSQRLTRDLHMPMDDYKSQDVGSISVHRVIDINVDSDSLSASATVG